MKKQASLQIKTSGISQEPLCFRNPLLKAASSSCPRKQCRAMVPRKGQARLQSSIVTLQICTSGVQGEQASSRKSEKNSLLALWVTSSQLLNPTTLPRLCYHDYATTKAATSSMQLTNPSCLLFLFFWFCVFLSLRQGLIARLALNSWSSCLHLPSIRVMYHHAWPGCVLLRLITQKVAGQIQSRGRLRSTVLHIQKEIFLNVSYQRTKLEHLQKYLPQNSS